MKRGAIFDMDGTLFDTEKIFWTAWIETADIFNLERRPDLPSNMSGSGRIDMPAILKKFYPNVDAEKYIMHVFDTVKANIEKNLEVKTGVENILNYFYENKVKMAIASSSETFVVEKNVKRVGWEKYFETFIGGDQVKKGKPDPEIFLTAAKAINFSPEDCYVFEDSFNGVRAGAAANCSTIMVIDLKEPTEEIRNLCTGVYNDMNEALTAIKNGEI